MPRTPHALVLLTLSLLLAACGGTTGGGGSDPPPVVNAIAEGAWSGTASGNSFDMLVLENGDMYAMYGNSASGSFQALGFIQGASSVSGHTLQVPVLTEFHFDNTAVVRATGSLSATVISGVSLIGSSNSTASAVPTFSATPTHATYSGYQYTTPAAVSDIAGAWSGYFLDQTQTLFSIDPAGVLAGSNGTCTFTGSVTPRPSNKNVFSVQLNPGPLCTAANVSTQGIAISYVQPDGKRRLLAATLDASKALGYLIYALR